MRAMLLAILLLSSSACALDQEWADRGHDQCDNEGGGAQSRMNCHDRVDDIARDR
jgi:hypothetical protein